MTTFKPQCFEECEVKITPTRVTLEHPPSNQELASLYFSREYHDDAVIFMMCLNREIMMPMYLTFIGHQTVEDIDRLEVAINIVQYIEEKSNGAAKLMGRLDAAIRVDEVDGGWEFYSGGTQVATFSKDYDYTDPTVYMPSGDYAVVKSTILPHVKPTDVTPFLNLLMRLVESKNMPDYCASSKTHDSVTFSAMLH